jgi:hypothetical protein
MTSGTVEFKNFSISQTGDGFVETWYDQSGNGNDATQGTAGSQPKIVDGGSLVADGLDFDGVNDRLFGSHILNTDDVLYAAVVAKNKDLSKRGLYVNNLFYNSSTDNGGFSVEAKTFNQAGKIAGWMYDTNVSASVQDGLSSLTQDQVQLLSFDLSNGSSKFHLDGSLVNTFSANMNSEDGGSPLNIGNSPSGAVPLEGSIKEIIIYNSDQSDNRTAIEANIGDHYDIDLPSGVDTGYDQVDGFVETWYDQSGNGNDAVQQVSGSQPKIVDAGVLVSGGIDFDGVDDSLGTNIFTLSAQPISKFAVGSFDSIAAASYFIDGSSDNRGVIGAAAAGTWRIFAGGTADDYATSISLSTNYLASGIFNGASTNLQVNGSNLGNKNVGTDGLDKVQIGSGNVGGGAFLDGKIAEIIIYPSDESANREAIEANINNQYDIY